MLRWAHINEKSAMFSTPAPFALSLSKGKRGVFQHPARASVSSHSPKNSGFSDHTLISLRLTPKPCKTITAHPMIEILPSGLLWVFTVAHLHNPPISPGLLALPIRCTKYVRLIVRRMSSEQEHTSHRPQRGWIRHYSSFAVS